MDVALGKRAIQSSVSAWSVGSPEDDASRALSAIFDPDFSFCTDEEQDPWWMVDLGAEHAIDEVWIYNRVANPARLSDFIVAISRDLETWHRVFSGNAADYAADDVIVCPVAQASVGRFVLIAVQGFTWLHLSRVRVFGRTIVNRESN